MSLTDFTEPTIRAYTTRALGDIPAPTDTAPYIPQLVSMISNSAEGVILWAQIVGGELTVGLLQGDTVEELIERFEGVPREMSDLYNRILSQLEPRTELETAMMIYLIQKCVTGTSVREIQCAMIVMDKTLHRPGIFGRLSADAFRMRLRARCRAMVDILPGDHWTDAWIKGVPWMSEVEREQAIAGTSSVTLIHKTLHDYLQKEKWAQRILAAASPMTPDLDTLWLDLCTSSILAVENSDEDLRVLYRAVLVPGLPGFMVKNLSGLNPISKNALAVARALSGIYPPTSPIDLLPRALTAYRLLLASTPFESTINRDAYRQALSSKIMLMYMSPGFRIRTWDIQAAQLKGVVADSTSTPANLDQQVQRYPEL